MYHILTYPYTHLGCFSISVIVNNAAINMEFVCLFVEKEMATHFSILAWRIPWKRSLWATVPGVTQSQTCLFSNQFSFLGTYSQKWDYWIICVSFLIFWGLCIPTYNPINSAGGVSFVPNPHQHLFSLLDSSHSYRWGISWGVMLSMFSCLLVG